MKVTTANFALLFLVAQGAAAVEQDPVWEAVLLPGGTGGLARAAGLDTHIEPWRVLYEASRRLHPTYGDPADAARLRQRVRMALSTSAPRLARGPEPKPVGRSEATPGSGMSIEADTVLLPLPPLFWSKSILRRPVPEDRLVEALLDDRQAALLYRGLFQLDDSTLRFFLGHPDLVAWIRNNQAEVFSVFAGSLRVHEGRVQVPGGAEAEALWASLVNESPTHADRFLRSLLGRDAGHTAFLFHTLDRLDEPARRFALGEGDADPARRRLRFRSLAAAFAQGPAWWRPEGGAFARPLVDPAVVLRLVRVEADGRLAGPASRPFWEAAFAGEVPTNVDRVLEGPPADAAWLAENVGRAATPAKRRERLTQLAFGQRVFGAITAADVRDALASLRGLVRYPALVLVLDRMDTHAPAVYAQTVARAEEIAALGSDRRGVAALAQFQGALALLDRARFGRTLGATETESLVASLAAVPLTEGRYHGGVARWIEERLLPAVGPAVDADPPSASAEETLLGALAGDRLVDPEARPFEWEGLWYRASPGVGEHRRLRAVRQRQHGNTMDAVLAFSRAVLRAQKPDAEGLSQLREAARALDTSGLSPDDQRDLKALGGASARRPAGLIQMADELLAETLTSLAYAPHLGSAQGTALAGANVARRHEFGAQAWELPEEVLGTGAPWRVRGSLLGLDVALARLSLRHLTTDMPARAPDVDPLVGLAFARTIAPRSPVALRDDEARAIAEAIARGRERVTAGDETADVLAREAGLDPWRARGFRATLDEARGSAGSFLKLSELLRLGRVSPALGDAWGTPDLARGGSLRLLPPPRGGYDDHLGQRLEDLHASRVNDLVLRVAVELTARHLPARLVPGVMSLFVQDFVQEASPTSHDDWLALARYARDAPAERFDEYVSALAGDGPLVPAPDPGEKARP